MLKVVPDTNILISAFISEGPEYEIIKLAKLGKMHLIVSHDLLWEFEEVLSRPKFGFTSEQVKCALTEIEKISEIVEIENELEVVKEDPDDNKIVETAVKGKADYLVSGDNHLLKLKNYENIKIVNSRFLLGIINN
jgi:putative PIN family toxin of toxin-antitoxin system